MSGQSSLARDFAALCSERGRDLFGESDLFDAASFENSGLVVDKVGGGWLLRQPNVASHAELHLFPHGGKSLPESFLTDHAEAVDSTLADIIVANSDAGTAALASYLAKRMLEDDARLCIAFFDVSRVFLDANRLSPDAQMPRRLYVGESPTIARYLHGNQQTLRERQLIPWIDAVDALAAEIESRVVFHHHSMDTISQSDAINDAEPFALRPIAQTFYRKPSIAPGAAQELHELAPRALIGDILLLLEEIFQSDADSPSNISIDTPLSMIPTPFRGCVIGDGYEDYWNILYEIRRDVIASAGGFVRTKQFVERLRSIVQSHADSTRVAKLQAGSRGLGERESR